jgi:hypothetical protein
MKKTSWLSLLIAFYFSMASAAPEEAAEKAPAKNEVSDILDSMGYPELQVVPRASERMAIEAKAEETSFVFTHWPIELSGVATIAVGFTAKGNQRLDLTAKEKADASAIASVTTTVGAAWLIGAVALGAQRPYRAGERAIAKYPGKDERSTLMRERLAEEAMERPTKVMRVLQTVSVITNFSANALAGVHANDTGRITAGVGALLAFLPWMFEDHNIEVYDKQMEYKRKIYAPLKSASFSYDTTTKTFTPMTNLVWMF